MFNKINTPCKNCIFAAYKENTQTDCLLDKLTLFRKYNIDIIEAYDEEKEFYVIKNKHCMWYRTKRWKHSQECLKTQLKLLNKEVDIQYQVIVFQTENEIALIKTLSSVLIQEPKPKHISVIKPVDNKVDNISIINILTLNNIPWRLQTMTDENLNRGNAIDLVIDIIHYPFYLVINSGYKIPKNTISNINKKIIEKLYSPLLLLSDNKGNGLFVNYQLHKAFCGNAMKNLIDKAKEYRIKLEYMEEVINAK